MANRTEEQKLSQEPLVVLLGGKEHKVKLLSIKDSRAWRADVSELLASLPQYMNITTDDPEGFGQAMSALIGSMPDKIVELFFKYAKELNREELETVANDQEIAVRRCCRRRDGPEAVKVRLKIGDQERGIRKPCHEQLQSLHDEPEIQISIWNRDVCASAPLEEIAHCVEVRQTVGYVL